MAKDDDVLRDAIIGTEKEIFAEGFGKEDLTLDETGDRSLESTGDGLEGQHEPEEADDEADAAQEAETPTEPVEAKTEAEAKETEPQTQEQQGRVPAGRLREEAERARQALAERDALRAQVEAETRARMELNARFEAMVAAIQRGQNPPPQPQAPKVPDLFEDPNAFAQHLTETVTKRVETEVSRLRQEQRDREINASLDSARQRHGQTYEEAFNVLRSLDYRNPANVALVRRMEASPNPGETLVAWHKRNTALREVGDDIDSYRSRVAEEAKKNLMSDPEFRKELIASMRGEAAVGDQGRPRTEVRLPPSLTRAAGSNARAPNDLEIFDGSDQATFASAWST